MLLISCDQIRWQRPYESFGFYRFVLLKQNKAKLECHVKCTIKSAILRVFECHNVAQWCRCPSEAWSVIIWKSVECFCFVLFLFFKGITKAYRFIKHWLLNAKHLVVVLISNHRANLLYFPVSSKGYFICTFQHTGQHIPWYLMRHWLEIEKNQTDKKNSNNIRFINIMAVQ